MQASRSLPTLLLACGLPYLSAAQITISSGSTLTVSHESSVVMASTDFLLVQPGGTLANNGRVVVPESVYIGGAVVTEVKGPTAGDDFGVLEVGDELDIEGTFTATLAPGFAPVAPALFEVATYDSRIGTFTGENLPAAAGTDTWALRYGPFGQSNILLALQAAPVPVSWLSFGAAPGPAGVTLDWATATETASAYFDVERARNPDADDWAAIGRVAAAGQSGTRRDYDFLDAAPGPAGTVYYRLRQVDTDGSFDYSETRAVRLTSRDYTLSVHPNPVTADALTLAGVHPMRPVKDVHLRSVTGQLISRFSAADAGGTLPLPTLASGVYFVEVVYASGEVATARFVRQ